LERDGTRFSRTVFIPNPNPTPRPKTFLDMHHNHKQVIKVVTPVVGDNSRGKRLERLTSILTP
jgi:hypothetical protein